MTQHAEAFRLNGVLSRLARNEEGNIIAILAISILPVVALIGGGIDMSRLYLAQTRLQSACDSGALLGRKVMGVGKWDADSGAANKKALEIFDQNFAPDSFGSHSRERSFTETGGNVKGTASAKVPMALMQIFGQKEKQVAVACQAELRIPNTDVMFVLDTTGSMNKPAVTDGEPKITGLRRAVNCFYEALAKENITDVTKEECGEASDPTNTNSGDVQLRFGFVPYASNVNVGKLLPQNYMVNRWTYQSREPVTATIDNPVAVYGTESAPQKLADTTEILPAKDWQNATENIVRDNITYPNNPPSSGVNCTRLPVPQSYTENIDQQLVLVSQVPAVPVKPESLLRRNYEFPVLTYARYFRYVFAAGNCSLQFRDTNIKIRKVNTYTTTPITWPTAQFLGWAYKPVSLDVSELKGKTVRWRGDVKLPTGENGASQIVPWEGCIEERRTVRGPDFDPSNDWDPIPVDALDMNIDLVPTSDDTTKWAPYLSSIVYQRYALQTNAGGVKSRSETRTMDTVTVSSTDNITMPKAVNACPSPATVIQKWTPATFQTYVKALKTDGFTYHDIGLLWGARIMSPTGIFAANNATPGKTINRHIVFMTDGDTQVVPEDYSSYGIHWYDRRQTPESIAPTEGQLVATVNARTAALCKAIKARNITLWVVSYAVSDTAANDRLKTCASEKKFFKAADTAELLARFKKIAAEISALRLTQ